MANLRRLLVVVAVPAEARALGEALGCRPRRLPGPFPRWNCQVGELRISVAASGIGAAAAAACTAWAAGRSRPDLVLSLGSAGSLAPDELPIGTVAMVRRERFAELGTRHPDGRFESGGSLGLGALEPSQDWIDLDLPVLPREGGQPRPGTPASAPRRGSPAPDLGSPPLLCDALTVSEVCGSHSLREERRATGARLEAMEGAGVAVAARRLRLPVLEIRAISNLAGPRDLATWDLALGNRRAATLAAAWIRAGAERIPAGAGPVDSDPAPSRPSRPRRWR